jgi:hypothetical protein
LHCSVHGGREQERLSFHRTTPHQFFHFLFESVITLKKRQNGNILGLVNKKEEEKIMTKLIEVEH